MSVSVKKDLVQCQKGPSTLSKECQKRPSTVSKECQKRPSTVSMSTSACAPVGQFVHVCLVHVCAYTNLLVSSIIEMHVCARAHACVCVCVCVCVRACACACVCMSRYGCWVWQGCC